MKKNKRLAIFLTIFVVLALLIVLSSAIFSLDSVSIKFYNDLYQLEGEEKNIISSANFRYGENVFLANKSEYIETLEKQNPYLRVLNIETIFPNKYVINAVERQETYCFKAENNYVITDERLKVLTKQKEFTNSTSNAIEVTSSGLEGINKQVGEILSNDDTYLQIMNCMREWQKTPTYADVKAKIKTIQIDFVDGVNTQNGNIMLTMWNNVELLIRNAKNKMSDKFNVAFSAFDSAKLADAKRIVVGEKDGEILAYAQTSGTD